MAIPVMCLSRASLGYAGRGQLVTSAFAGTTLNGVGVGVTANDKGTGSAIATAIAWICKEFVDNINGRLVRWRYAFIADLRESKSIFVEPTSYPA